MLSLYSKTEPLVLWYPNASMPPSLPLVEGNFKWMCYYTYSPDQAILYLLD